MLVAKALSSSLYIPSAYLFAAAFALGWRKREGSWRLAEALSVCALLGALAQAGMAIWPGLSLGPIRHDPLGHLLTLLVTFVGWVVVRFSRHYLAGEPGQIRFIAALSFTLAAVSLVVTTRNLLMLAAAWTVSSVGLHVLLTFYRARRGALVAAHKKFLVSRLAELCLGLALVSIFRDQHSFEMSRVLAAAGPHAPVSLRVAMIFIAVAVILKSAQLPMHGWLIQVMEAPTPVSALLHAGIVNIGGFILIRLAPLLASSPFAEGLVLASGLFTAVIAGLVMATSNTVKERLAWSTCSQMGFMLVECGLGFYELALLHLLAHSAYKAYAFLGAGEAVAKVRYARMLGGEQAKPSLRWRLLAGVLAVVLVIALGQLWTGFAGERGPAPLALIIIGLGLAPLAWTSQGRFGSSNIKALSSIVILAQLYLFWHLCFRNILPSHPEGPSGLTSLLVVAAFGLLYAVQCWISCRPGHAFSNVLHGVFHTGLALDEWFTRLSFRIWPLRCNGARFLPYANLVLREGEVR